MSVIAYEDIGLANPNIGPFVHAAIEFMQKLLGLPEARIPLANAVIQLALSVKSNTAITAIDSALSEIKQILNLLSLITFVIVITMVLINLIEVLGISTLTVTQVVI